jgi:hypothetical protein
METKENKTFNQDYTDDRRESCMSSKYSAEDVVLENKEVLEDLSKLNLKGREDSKNANQVKLFLTIITISF